MTTIQRRHAMKPARNGKGFTLATWCLLILALGIGNAAPSSAIPFKIRITADNFYAVYTGTMSAVTAMHFNGAWPTVMAPPTITPVPTDNFLYVVAWDDAYSLQGLVATITAGAGYVTTGSGLWTVCATNTPVNAPPTPANLTAKIVTCNQSSGGWRPTSN